MANCSFIRATEARNLARNDTLLWSEISEVQTQILAAIDGTPCTTPPVPGAYSVLVTDGTPMTSLQSILSVAVDNGGTNYTPVVATAVINANGTGGTNAAVTPVVTGTTITGFTVDVPGSGYVPVIVTASVQTNYNLNDAQTQVNYDGLAGDGTFLTGGTGVNAATGYFSGEVITLSENSTATVIPVDGGQRVLIAGQDETNYAASFGGGTGYTNVAGGGLETITLNDGAVVQLDTVAGGIVTEFDVISSSTNSNVTVTARTQLSTTGLGTGFSLTSNTNNETIVGVVDTFTVASAGADPFFLGSQITQASTTGIGVGFALAPTTNNAAVITHAGVAAVLTPIEAGGVITNVVVNTPGTTYVVGQPIIFSHPTGTGATASIATINGTGGITGITITNGSSGYDPAVATVTVTAPGGATPALAFAGTVAVTGGVVTGIIISEGGLGYTDLLPTATVNDPTGSGATFTTNVAGGALTAINVIAGGAGYTAPIMTITAAPTSNGAGATATATIGTNTFGTTPSVYNDVLTGQSTDVVITDQIQYILDYFTALGYNIRAQTNPATADTIQWQIIW